MFHGAPYRKLNQYSVKILNSQFGIENGPALYKKENFTNNKTSYHFPINKETESILYMFSDLFNKHNTLTPMSGSQTPDGCKILLKTFHLSGHMIQ